MNEDTANFIEFLNRYELGFGADASDFEIVSDPRALKDKVAHLLVQPPVWMTAEYAQMLRDSIDGADWDAIAEEQRNKIRAADTLQAGSEGQKSGEIVTTPTA